jgi:4-hydroxy-3-methylbut-2-en-1-yl diphosphate reductase
MKIEIDRKSGFCFGVIEAISKAENELKKEGQLYCLGDIVHNGAEVDRLTKLGMVSLTRNEFYQMRNCHVLIRAHGEPPETYDYARKNNITLIDATCPVVLHLQKRVKTSFQNMVNQGGQLVIFGKPGHAEIEGINGQIGNKAIVIQSREEVGIIDNTKPVELYSQTTMPIAEFNEIAKAIRERAEDTKIRIRDTICRQVANRGPHLKEFAKKFDMVIFVAGIKSSNGAVLFEMCKSVNSNTYRVDSSENINTAWFTGMKTVGICGATSTPRWLMENVAKWIEENVVV